jgi:hypothetical protein
MSVESIQEFLTIQKARTNPTVDGWPTAAEPIETIWAVGRQRLPAAGELVVGNLGNGS